MIFDPLEKSRQRGRPVTLYQFFYDAVPEDDSCTLFLDFLNTYAELNGIAVPLASVFTGGAIDANGWYTPGGIGFGAIGGEALDVFVNPAGATIVIEYLQPVPYDLTGARFNFETAGDNGLFASNIHTGVEYYDDNGPGGGSAGSDLIGICRFAVSGNTTHIYGSQNGAPATNVVMGSPALFSPGNEINYPGLYTSTNTTGAETRVRSFCLRPYAGPAALPALSAVAARPYPDASNSGYQPSMGALTNYSSPITTTANGQVIEGFNSSSSIHVMHKDCVVRKGRLTGSGAYAIKTESTLSNVNTIIEDVTILGGYTAGVSGELVTVNRCDISGCQNGILYNDYRDIVTNSYIHGMMAGQPDCCIRSTFANGRMFIQHNTLMCDQPGTAAIFITDQNNAHPSTQVIYTVVIHDNLIGGGVHSLVLDNSTFNTSIDNFHVTDNRFDPFGSSGYARISPAARTNVLWFGNVDGNGNTLAKP